MMLTIDVGQIYCAKEMPLIFRECQVDVTATDKRISPIQMANLPQRSIIKQKWLRTQRPLFHYVLP